MTPAVFRPGAARPASMFSKSVPAKEAARSLARRSPPGSRSSIRAAPGTLARAWSKRTPASAPVDRTKMSAKAVGPSVTAAEAAAAPSIRSRARIVPAAKAGAVREGFMDTRQGLKLTSTT
jgi:hypothetical protein